MQQMQVINLHGGTFTAGFEFGSRASSEMTESVNQFGT
jgi:hypothetical protein